MNGMKLPTYVRASVFLGNQIELWTIDCSRCSSRCCYLSNTQTYVHVDKKTLFTKLQLTFTKVDAITLASNIQVPQNFEESFKETPVQPMASPPNVDCPVMNVAHAKNAFRTGNLV